METNHTSNNSTEWFDINITDFSGNTFTIKLKWDICEARHSGLNKFIFMKLQIARHYEEQYKTNFCNEKGIAIHEFHTTQTYFYEWINSDYYKKTNDYNPDNIQLIYKGEILNEFDIDYLYTLDDFKEDNNINVVIIKNDENNDDDKDDNDSNISFISD